MKPFLVSLIAFALIVLTGAAWQIIDPSFTDEQIAGSLVDTWEPHALVTSIVLVLLIASAGFAGVVFAFGNLKFKRLSLATCLALVAAAGLELLSHILLSNQVTRVTGQPLGAVYGLL